MRPIRKPALPATIVGATVLGIGNSKCTSDRSDAIVFAEPWAAQHNAELWGSHRPPDLKANREK